MMKAFRSIDGSGLRLWVYECEVGGLGQDAFEKGGLLERLGEVGFNRIALQVDLPASELKRKEKENE